RSEWAWPSRPLRPGWGGMTYPCAMRGRDEDSGEFHAPSRSERRRAALDVLSLGETLAGLPPARLAKLPVPDALLPHIEDTRRITSHVARKRRSEEHTSELQSRENLVCRLLLEK